MRDTLKALSLLFVIIFITGCFNSGITKEAQISIQNNGTHNEKEINKVIKQLKNDFYIFKDCKLLSIDYNSKEQGIKDWNDKKYYDIIVLKFDFMALKNTELFIKNNKLQYRAYYGKKTKNSNWERIDWGQG